MKTDKTIRKHLHDIALNAPQSAGVYLWKDENGKILYVGKAKNLKNRLSSYFSGKKDIKTRILISHSTSIEYIVVSTEYEAFVLENTLIKQHSPKYNINLKDDKSYPALRITNEEYPRIFKTRRIVQDGSRYFGPFPNSGALDTFIEYLYRRYPLRYCKKFRKRNSPCMYYHIGRCKAPCCDKIDKKSYIDSIDEICHFLDGNPQETIEILKKEMEICAKNREYEKAARIRDGIIAIEELHAVTTVNDFDPDARDYIGVASEGTLVSFVVLKMRGGRLVMKDLYRTHSVDDDEDLLSQFFSAFYENSESIPAKIIVPHSHGLENVKKWLRETYGVNPDFIVVNSLENEKISSENTDNNYALSIQQSADSTKYVATSIMAQHNAKEDISRRVRERGDFPAMKELQKFVGMEHLPVRIEGFDIAHLQGKYPVASLISFYNGNPDKKNYRYFKLRTTDGKVDDFASMREVAARRYTRLLNEGEELPDLILVDGGIGQVNAVAGVLESLDLNIPLIGLAEKNEEIYFPGNSTPAVLPRRSDALRLLQRVRDETHRFATKQQQKLRNLDVLDKNLEKNPHNYTIKNTSKNKAQNLVADSDND
ncbi:MAG: excinuclease ABC subunit UvrC [Treponema sp.]|nr:excinuclease ABC subunit UvrC [Treponema sp.]